MQPETHYAISADGTNVAYQVLGDGDRDLVLVPGWIFHVEVVWEQPAFEAFMTRLARNFRVILFDKRGTGLSDSAVGASSMEERMDDVRAVMDAVGSHTASLMGWSEGGNIAALFAATYPERVTSLILYGVGARYAQADDYPIGLDEDFIEMAKTIIRTQWGEGIGATFVAPSRSNDEAFVRWFGRYERLTVSPGSALKMVDVNLQIDTTDVLRQLQTPTLVMHNVRDRLISIEAGRYIARNVPHAKLVELDGDDHLFWFDNPDDVVGEIEDFLIGVRTDPDPERVLATILLTDIDASTERASALGDARWREVLDIHDRVARETLARFRGTFVKSTGDGLLATFDGPGRAVACALRMKGALEGIGVSTRAGVHTGEVEIRGDDIGGLAVHVAARIVQLARPGQVLTSRTVKDLAAGAGIRFSDAGEHQLRGLSEPWKVFHAETEAR